MNNQPEFYFENGISRCIITTKHGKFEGIAKCHPDDHDMESEKTGCEIAYYRATLAALKHARNNVIKPSLQALKQLYYSMNRSKYYNKKSYESKMLWSQIQNWQFDLDTINKMIATTKQSLTEYIKIKEELYQSIRKNREKVKSN